MFSKLKESIWIASGWTIVIFILLTLPTESLPEEEIFDISDFDKLVHVAIFGIFLWFWVHWWAARKAPEPTKISDILVIFLIACAYGIGMEFYQKYFTTRNFDIGDIYADSAGAGVAGIVYIISKKISPYRNRGRNQN